MAINYTGFSEKYGETFFDLTEERFNLALADALPEINLYNWGELRDRATEMLIGHLLTINSSSASEAAVEKVDIFEEVSFTFSKRSDSYDASWFGKEYKRLLGLIQNATVDPTPTISSKGAHFGANRIDSNPMKW